MIVSMSKEFGVPINDLNELLNKSDTFVYDDVDNLNKNNDDLEYGYEKKNIPHTSRIWTPIDNENDKFLRSKLEKQNHIQNFISNNIESVHESSELNKYFLIKLVFYLSEVLKICIKLIGS